MHKYVEIIYVYVYIYIYSKTYIIVNIINRISIIYISNYK